MTKLYLFDVDGTLTPSRQKIDKQFEEYFLDFCAANDVATVSGSDYPKTLEQLRQPICSKLLYIFSNSGNEVRKQGDLIHQHLITLPHSMRTWFQKQLDNSLFDIRTGKHVEERAGSVNFSIVGRNATASDREAYKQWDTQTNERNKLVTDFTALFPDFEASCGGETGIDIYEIGKSKSQILQFLPSKYHITFFGDGISPNGNDYTLAQDLVSSRRGIYYSVSSWQQTQEYLRYING